MCFYICLAAEAAEQVTVGGLFALFALVLWELVSSDKGRMAARHDDSSIHNFFLPNEAELVIQGIVLWIKSQAYCRTV